MKKIFTYLSPLYLLPFIGDAQFETGQKVIGGSLSAASSSGNATPSFDNRSIYHTTNTGITVSPSIAKFYKPTLLRGIGFIYGYGNYTYKEEAPDYGNGYKSISHNIGINAFSQRFISLGNSFFFTLQTSGTALFTIYKQNDFLSKATAKGRSYLVSAALAPGVSYKINNRFLFDAFLSSFLSASYAHTSTTLNYPLPRETKTHSDGFSIASSLSDNAIGNIAVGFRWLLKRK